MILSCGSSKKIISAYYLVRLTGLNIFKRGETNLIEKLIINASLNSKLSLMICTIPCIINSYVITKQIAFFDPWVDLSARYNLADGSYYVDNTNELSTRDGMLKVMELFLLA